MSAKIEEIKEILGKITLEGEAQSLFEDKRIADLQIKGDSLHIKYERREWDVSQKRELEQLITKSLSALYTEEQLFFIPVSGQKTATSNEAKPAQLKVGHGTVGEKKKINGVKSIIAIGSGKGGVGKSTFTTNLACSLKSMGHKVGIIDADIYGPSLPHMFGMSKHQPKTNENQKILPLEGHGVKFISFGSFIHEDEPVVWRGPMLGGVLNQFFFDTDWGELDFLLIDLPPGTGDVQLSMIQNLEVDGAIIISTPQDVAMLDSRKALHMFDKLNLHVIGMVENMSSFICDKCDSEHFLYGTGGVKSTCNELGVGFLGGISMDINLRKSADFGHPYMANEEKFKDSKIWKDYHKIAKSVTSYMMPSETKKQSLLGKIFKKK